MIVARVHDDEVDDEPQAHAVSQIAEDTGEQQRTGTENAIVITRRLHKVIKDCHAGGGGEYDEEPARKRAAILKVAESDAGILGVSEIMKKTNDDAILAEAQRLNGPRLRRLVGHKNDERGEQVAGARGEACSELVGLIGF